MHDYVELITLALWVISVVGISRVHFKNKRLEQFRNTADNLMKSYVRLYDKENLSDEQKINRVGNAVVNSLEAKGFKLNRQEVQDIFAEVAKQMNEQTQDK
ncbi:helveticin [Lactobacillus crispatus]|uniref:helveticin n=1 Tax=Lactobacillus crispatus TaxID=47770 RepID=UPI0018AA0E91|nr:helveticin [Lactobacillus crispatus]